MYLPNDSDTQTVMAAASTFTWVIPAADISALSVEHAELPGLGINQLYLRLSVNDGSTSAPTIEIHAGDGTFVNVASSPSLETGTGDVGTAQYIGPATVATQLIRFNLTEGIGSFDLHVRVTDTNGGTHRYVGVVDGPEADTLRPWIHVDPAQGHPDAWNQGKRLLTGETADLAVVIENLGTGELQLVAPADPLAPNFAVQDAASAPLSVPPRGSVTWTVEVTADAEPSEASFPWTIATSNDTPVSGSDHNADVTLSGAWGLLEVVFVLDASGSMFETYEGETPSGGEFNRWEELYNAVGAFCSLLQTIAIDDNGQISVVIYPDRNQDPIVAETTVTHVDRESITESTFADTIDQPVGSLQFSGYVQDTFGRTAITHALGIGTGPTSATYGRFDSSTAARTYNHRFVILMTDGLNNEGPGLDEYYDTGSRANWLVDKRINYLAIPYGPPEDATGVARDELAKIAADQTDASVGIVGAMLDPADTAGEMLGLEQLQNAFKKALATSLNLEFDGDPVVVIPGGGVFVHEAFVTRYDRYVSFSLGQIRQPEIITIDATVAPAAAVSSRFIDVALIRPDGHEYTLEELAAHDDVRISVAAANLAITLTEAFLGDRQDPSNVNLGAWKLRLTNNGERTQRVTYGVLVQSALRLSLNYASGRAIAGEDLDVEATLTLFGRPLTGAAVELRVRAPNDSAINWLAGQVLDDAGKAALEELVDSGGDYTGATAKQEVLAELGVVFTGSASSYAIVMHDSDGDGVYRAKIPNTATQGTYQLDVRALGTTSEGAMFRRELGVGVILVPRPDPDFSIFGLDFALLGGGQVQATVSYKPLDAAGNVILFDPASSNRVEFQVDGATWTGPMQTEFDGVYTRVLTFPETARPNLDVIVDGEIVTHDLPIPSIPELAWACQAVLHAGTEAKPGANRYVNPNVAEGNPFEGPEDFVALGGGGRLYVLPDRVCPRMRSITVFVQPDTSLREYKVEVLTIPGLTRRWVEVGRSRGVTQTFDLGELRRRHVFGIRVTDLSRTTRNPDLSPSVSPGVSIRGVGFEPGRRWW